MNTSSRHLVAWAGVALAGIAAIMAVRVALRADTRDSLEVAPHRAHTAHVRMDGPAEALDPPERLMRSEELLDSQSAILEEQLAAIHGEQWFERRKFLIERGIDLEKQAPLPPWEEVESVLLEKSLLLPATREHVLENSVDWPEELTSEWIETRFAPGFQLSALDLAELQQLALPVNLELRAIAERYLDDIDQAIAHSFALRKVVRAPFTTSGLPRKPSEGNFYSTAQGHRRWAVSLSLASEDYPHIPAAQKEIEARRKQRDREVWAHLEALKKQH